MRSVVIATSGDGRAQGGDALQELRRRVPTVHGGEHAVGAGLRRQVHVLADRGQLRDGLHERRPTRSCGCDVMKRTRARPGVSSRARSSAGEVGRAASPAASQVQAVGVHVLAEQRDLAHAAGGEVREPRPATSWSGAAALRAAHVRHDAVRAEVGAARHDLHPGLVGPVSPRRSSPLRRGPSSKKPGGRCGCAGSAAASSSSGRRCRFCGPSAPSTYGKRLKKSCCSACGRQPVTSTMRSGSSRLRRAAPLR